MKEKEEEEKRKAGIVEIIRRDRQERDEDLKHNIEHRLNTASGKIAKVEDGVVVWVDPPPLKLPKTPAKEPTLRTISDLSPDHHHHHPQQPHHQHHHNPFVEPADSDSDSMMTIYY